MSRDELSRAWGVDSMKTKLLGLIAMGSVNMIGRLKSIFASVLLLAGSFNVATAATVLEEPTLYSDLSVGTVYNLAGFTLGPISGSYDLVVRYGIWGGLAQQVDIALTFDGTTLTPTIIDTGAYYTPPLSASFDVSSLVHSGLNTLSVDGVNDSGPVSGVGSYAIGPVPAATPLPAALPLFATGLGALGLLGWRRNRKNAAAIAAA